MAWQDKRESERPNETKFIQRTYDDRILEIRDDFQLLKKCGIYPQENLNDMIITDQKHKQVSIFLGEIVLRADNYGNTDENQNEPEKSFTTSRPEYTEEDPETPFMDLDLTINPPIKQGRNWVPQRGLAQHNLDKEALKKSLEQLKKSFPKKQIDDNEDYDDEESSDGLQYQDLHEQKDQDEDGEKSSMFKDEENLLAHPKMPDQITGSFLHPYYFPDEKRHEWVKNNHRGYKYATFEQIDSLLYQDKSYAQKMKRREKEDEKRSYAIAIRFFMFIMIINIVGYLIYHLISGDFFSKQSALDNLTDLQKEVNEICSSNETSIDYLIDNYVYDMRIKPSQNGQPREFEVDGKNFGSKFCVKVKDGRGFILKSLEDDLYEQIKNGVFSVLSNKEIQQWFDKSHTHDQGAVEPIPFPFNQFMADDKHETYGNREVNLGQAICKERGAEYAFFDSTKMTFTNDQELKYTFAKEVFYMSVFFIKMITCTLLLWMAISAYGSNSAFKSFHELPQHPNSLKPLIFLGLNTYDFVKDYQLLITQKHSAWFVILYSSTIAVSIVLYMWKNKLIQQSLRDQCKPNPEFRCHGIYTVWKLKKDREHPIEVNQLQLFISAFKSLLGFNDDLDDKDLAQKRYLAEKIIKKYENIPQVMLVLYEVFKMGTTITFVQMFNPIFGLLMAVLTFSANVGHNFRAEYPYVFYNDFKYTLPEELQLKGQLAKYNEALKDVVQKIEDDLTSEEWQQISRLNSGTKLLSKAFNLKNQEKYLNKLLFNQKKFTREERILNGLMQLVETQGLLLVLFVMLFGSFLNPESSVSELISNEMVVDPASIDNPFFQAFRLHSNMILSLIFLGPLLAIGWFQFNLMKRSKIQITNSLTEPLLGDKKDQEIDPDCPYCPNCKVQMTKGDDKQSNDDEDEPSNKSSNQQREEQDDEQDDQQEDEQEDEEYGEEDGDIKCNECQQELTYLKDYLNDIDNSWEPYFECKKSCYEGKNIIICGQCATKFTQEFQGQQIQKTDKSIRIFMSNRFEFYGQGILEVKDQYDFIQIKANWCQKNMLAVQSSYKYKRVKEAFEKMDFILGLSKIPKTKEAESNKGSQVGSDDDQDQEGDDEEQDGSQKQSNESGSQDGQESGEGDLSDASQDSEEESVQSDLSDQDRAIPKHYNPRQIKALKYRIKQERKREEEFIEIFRYNDQSLNQTDVTFGSESRFVRKLQIGDKIQLVNPNEGPDIYSINFDNMIFLTLEIELFKNSEVAVPLFKYVCPDCQGPITRYPMNSKEFRDLTVAKYNTINACGYKDVKRGQFGVDKYFCKKCEKPFSSRCVFENRIARTQPKNN